MVVPFLTAAAAGALSRAATASAKDKEAKEKLDLTKHLAFLTPDQIKAIDAIKGQSLEEMKTRVELGIGPFKPLPEKASEKAKEARERRVAKLQERRVGKKLVRVTDRERAEVAEAPDKEAAVKALVDKKVEEARRRMGA